MASRPRLKVGTDVLYKAFVLMVMLVLLVPLCCMPAWGGDGSAEKRELASAPSLTNEDGSPNLNVLSDAGAFFADHFAFRNVLVEANASLRQRLFMVSAVPEVVVGKDGWLFYEGELNDYWRKQTLANAGIENAAINLALMQESLNARGKRFVLAIAPNKSTVYPEHMPYYYVPGAGQSIYERLRRRLGELGVNVADLQAALEGKPGRYFQRDSHWNEEGMLVAFDAIGRCLEFEEMPTWGEATDTVQHTGDLDAMLHPVLMQPEAQPHRAMLDAYQIRNDAQGVEDPYIVTVATGEHHRRALLMFRDSFANNLLAPFACTYGTAVFTKNVPYNLGDEQVSFAQDVVVERAERHIASFATNPPYMPALERHPSMDGPESETEAEVRVRDAEPYLMIEGSLSRDYRAGERIYVEVTAKDGDSHTYEAFRVSEPRTSTSDFEGQGDEAHVTSVVHGDKGFRAFVLREGVDEGSLANIRLFVGTEQACHEITTHTVG